MLLPLPPRRLMQHFFLTIQQLFSRVRLHWPCGYAPLSNLPFLRSILADQQLSRLITLKLAAASRTHSGDLMSQKAFCRLQMVWQDKVCHGDNPSHTTSTQATLAELFSSQSFAAISSTNFCTRGTNMFNIPYFVTHLPGYSQLIRWRLAGWCFPPETLILDEMVISGAPSPKANAWHPRPTPYLL